MTGPLKWILHYLAVNIQNLFFHDIQPKGFLIQRYNHCFHNLPNKKVMIFLQNHVKNPFAHQKCQHKQLQFSRFCGYLRSIWPLKSQMRSSSFKYHVALRSEAMRTKIFDINVRSNRVKIIDCLSPLRGCTDFAPNLT